METATANMKYLLATALSTLLITAVSEATNLLSEFITLPSGMAEHVRRVSDGRLYLEIDDMLIPVGTDAKSGSWGTKWPNGVVYYQFHSSVDAVDSAQLPGDGAARRTAFRAAAMEWQETVPGLTFVEGTGNGNYILVKSANRNDSYVGMTGGAQDMNILLWAVRFVVAHEIGHALGLVHEQNRPDRGTYVTINYDNIQDDKEYIFSIWPGTASFGGYDYGSVMHYDRCAFFDTAVGSCGVNGFTIDAKAAGAALVGLSEAEANFAMGQLNDLSPGDIAGVRALYTPASTIFGSSFENGRTNAWSSVVGEAIPCAHGLCAEGVALNSECDPCVATVCTDDPYCCGMEWDSTCISKAISWCGYSCP